MQQRDLFRKIIEYIVFLVGIFFISIIAVITNLQGNDCADIKRDRQDFVCTE